MADTTGHISIPPDKVAILIRVLVGIANIITNDSVVDNHQSAIITSFVSEQTAGMSPLEAFNLATDLILKLKSDLTISAAATSLSLQPLLSTLLSTSHPLLVTSAMLALRSSDERPGVPQTVNTRNGDDVSSITTPSTTTTMLLLGYWYPLPLSFPTKPNSRELTSAMLLGKKCIRHVCPCVIDAKIDAAKKKKPYYTVRYSKPKKHYITFQCPCQTSQIKVVYNSGATSITPQQHSSTTTGGWFAHYYSTAAPPDPSSSATGISPPLLFF